MDTLSTHDNWARRLVKNSRFWILAAGVTLSVLIAGAIQLVIPGGNLQTIRIEQVFGFSSLALLYLAVLASPLTKVWPKLPFKDSYLFARRAIGVLAFYYAALHVYLTFFHQLDGFTGIRYYSGQYRQSIIFGLTSFAILFLLAITSFDLVIRKLHFKNWKLLQRLVYVACLTLVLHILLIGPHFARLNPVSTLTYLAIIFLLILEGLRIRLLLRRRTQT